MIPESGCITRRHQKAVMNALKKGRHDPSYLSSISGLGPVKEFEKDFAKAVGGKYALALSSCTAALHTALMVYGIGPGDEVIVTPYTWGQSVAPALFTGATAVFADIDPKTLTIDPESVRERVSEKTKAIMPVHIFGIPADMDGLISIANQYGLAIISDAAQAFGALSKGRKIGSLGDISCFSIGRGKAVFGGEGGVLVTNNATMYERAITISQHPLRSHRDVLSINSFFMGELNWNYRIHPLAAVLGIVDLEKADAKIRHRQRVLKQVCEKLKLNRHLDIVTPNPCDTSAAYGNPLTFNLENGDKISRESLVNSMRSKGNIIQAGPIRVPIHLREAIQNNSCFRNQISQHTTHRKGSCIVAEMRCEKQELFAII